MLNELFLFRTFKNKKHLYGLMQLSSLLEEFVKQYFYFVESFYSTTSL